MPLTVIMVKPSQISVKFGWIPAKSGKLFFFFFFFFLISNEEDKEDQGMTKKTIDFLLGTCFKFSMIHHFSLNPPAS
jgi:hypothetical protein